MRLTKQCEVDMGIRRIPMYTYKYTTAYTMAICILRHNNITKVPMKDQYLSSV